MNQASRFHSLLLGLAAVLLVAAGCRAGSQEPAGPVVVAAAASAAPAIRAAAAQWSAQSGVPLEVTSGSSSLLQQQILQGAPIDVFFSADRARVDELAAAGAVDPATVQVYAIGRMVLVQRPDAAALLGAPGDLATAPFAQARIAIANPATAPYGAAAREALHALGLAGPGLEERLVIAENVAQALEFARTGNADVAFAAESNLPPSGLHVVEIPGSLHDPLQQACGLTTRGAAREPARSFQAFLLGEPGRAILEAHGFALPPP